jgi:DNA topoisomerase-6 subunit B
VDTTWKNYGIGQSRGALPQGPMVIFVHMASVWVPFTSESKEAIADYDEIRKEITLALRECGRRLGVFLRRRGRAQSEFRRRNIFELYIEEVVDACNRLKGGKLPAEKIKEQLQKIAKSKTGGLKTDELLGKTGAGPEGLPDSIIVTEEGVEGEIAVVEPDLEEAEAPAAAKKKGKAQAKGNAAAEEESEAPDDEEAAEPPAAKKRGKGKAAKAKTKGKAAVEVESEEPEDEEAAEPPVAAKKRGKAKTARAKSKLKAAPQEELVFPGDKEPAEEEPAAAPKKSRTAKAPRAAKKTKTSKKS